MRVGRWVSVEGRRGQERGAWGWLELGVVTAGRIRRPRVDGKRLGMLLRSLVEQEGCTNRGRGPRV